MENETNKNRVALITGSTSGIGKAIAQRLANNGYTVAFHSKTSVEEGRNLASLYTKATYTQADLSVQKDRNFNTLSLLMACNSDPLTFSEILAGIIFDRDSDTKFYNIEASRRFGDNWKAELEVRLFISRSLGIYF